MKERARKNTARTIAETYAPQPKSGAFMYAVLGTMCAGLCLIIFGKFYAVDVIAHPAWISGIVVSAITAAVILWVVRNRRHEAARGAEYDKLIRKAEGEARIRHR
jgi:uncharacterized membrane protein YeaQ/YmgE (transglycosylase-associated protein family)